MSGEQDRLLGHADENDGIREYDNPLPDWWVGLFWLTILWSIGYAAHYHWIADRSQEAELAAEMAAAEARWPDQAQEGADDDVLVVDVATAEAGARIYATQCVACHGAELEGGIGPSFVDDEWIHGGTASDILRIIREGVPAKGMIPWQGILSPGEIKQVAAFVISRHAEGTGRDVQEILAPADPAPAEGGERDPGGP